ncbi:hypothetical protein [Haladaptatus halobius]|uniref:hypothetical protein n=1 Tax=Haladaptatus halobius TaxID=2884875 RepID=UPI001D0AE037|nr:hypothetical protein [Haladaptatus halobius]
MNEAVSVVLAVVFDVVSVGVEEVGSSVAPVEASSRQLATPTRAALTVPRNARRLLEGFARNWSTRG